MCTWYGDSFSGMKILKDLDLQYFGVARIQTSTDQILELLLPEKHVKNSWGPKQQEPTSSDSHTHNKTQSFLGLTKVDMDTHGSAESD